MSHESIQAYKQSMVQSFMQSSDITPVQKFTYQSIAKTDPERAYIYLWSILDAVAQSKNLLKRHEMQQKAQRSSVYIPRRWFDI